MGWQITDAQAAGALCMRDLLHLRCMSGLLTIISRVSTGKTRGGSRTHPAMLTRPWLPAAPFIASGIRVVPCFSYPARAGSRR